MQANKSDLISRYIRQQLKRGKQPIAGDCTMRRDHSPCAVRMVGRASFCFKRKDAKVREGAKTAGKQVDSLRSLRAFAPLRQRESDFRLPRSMFRPLSLTQTALSRKTQSPSASAA